jgi:hypothetical protein
MCGGRALWSICNPKTFRQTVGNQEPRRNAGLNSVLGSVDCPRRASYNPLQLRICDEAARPRLATIQDMAFAKIKTSAQTRQCTMHMPCRRGLSPRRVTRVLSCRWGCTRVLGPGLCCCASRGLPGETSVLHVSFHPHREQTIATTLLKAVGASIDSTLGSHMPPKRAVA